MRLVPLLLAMCCATLACSPEVQRSEPEAKATLDPLYAGPPSLVGEWRVGAVDDTAVDLGWAITVSVTPDRIGYQSQCVSGTWTYEYARGQLTTEAVPLAVCDRGRYPAEDGLDAVFDAGGTAMTTPENGVRIEGGGHSVTLFSQ